MKVQITLDDELVKRVDNYADENFMSRSGFISLSLTQYLNSLKVQTAITNMAIAMRKIADEGKIDADVQRELEDFERICKMLVPSK